MAADESLKQAERNQDDGNRIEKVEHGQGVCDDLAQPDIRDCKGEERKENGVFRVGQRAREELHERRTARRDKSNCSLEACAGDRDAEQNAPACTEVMRGDMGEHVAAVCVHPVDGAALRADIREREVDDRHECGAECAGDNCAVRESLWIRQAEPLDRIDENIPERKRGEYIHRVVALEESREEGVFTVCADRLHIPDRAHWRNDRRYNQNAEEEEKEWVQYLAYPDEDVRGTQGEVEDDSEEDKGKDK